VTSNTRPFGFAQGRLYFLTTERLSQRVSDFFITRWYLAHRRQWLQVVILREAAWEKLFTDSPLGNDTERRPVTFDDVASKLPQVALNPDAIGAVVFTIDGITLTTLGYDIWKQRVLHIQSTKGGPLTRQMLHVIIQQIFKGAGIDQSPHALRKTGANLYYQQSEYDIEATRQHLGHADLSTTLRPSGQARKYLGLASEKIIEYSERTAKHLKRAIETGAGAEFDTSASYFYFDRFVVATSVAS